MNFLKKQWFCIAVIIAGLTVITFFLIQFNIRVREHEAEGMQVYLEEIRDNSVYMLRSEMEHISAVISGEARTFGLLGPLTDEDIVDELRSFPLEKSMLRVHILTTEGKFYSSLNNQIKQMDPGEYGKVLNQRKEHISLPRYSDTFNKMVIEVSAPLYINGNYTGVLVGCYDVEFFEKLLTNRFLRGDCTLYVAAANGTLVLQNSQQEHIMNIGDNIFDFYNKSSVRFTISSSDKLEENIKLGLTGYAGYDYEGISRYISYTPAGVNNWYVAAVSTNKTLVSKTQSINEYAFHLVIQVSIVILLISVVIILIGIREQKQVQKMLKWAADTDALTQLYNRPAIERMVTEHLLRKGMNNRQAVMMFDIDRFKEINDSMGHLKGDEVLSEFGRLLTRIFPKNSIIGRMGGDEFIALLPDARDTEDVKQIAASVCREFGNMKCLFDNFGKMSSATVSVGIAYDDQGTLKFNELYKRADTALYESKKNGKNCYTFYRDIHPVCESSDPLEAKTADHEGNK